MAVPAGIAAIISIGRNPDRLEGKGLAAAGIVLGSVFSLALVGAVVGIVALFSEAVEQARKAQNEQEAVKVLARISQAQETFANACGRYGELEELMEEGLLSEGALRTSGGYVISFGTQDGGVSYEMRATPSSPEAGGHFFLRNGEGIRYEAAKPAGPRSRVFSSVTSSRSRVRPRRVVTSSG
jgi:hypothetical protein